MLYRLNLKGEKMEEIEIIPASKITRRIIENWLLWGVIIQLCYGVILNIIIKNVNANVLKIILSIVLQIIAVCIIWKISNAKAFKGKSIYRRDIPEIMKNLTIFTIVICIISIIFVFSIVNEAINEISYEMKERYKGLINIYGEDVYNQQMELLIEPVKKQINSYIVIIQIASSIIYLVMLVFEKKELLNYTVLVE